MANEEQLPDLDKLSEDLGYDFTEDEPDLSHLKESPRSDVADEAMPSFAEIEDELAAIRPHRSTSQSEESSPDTEYVMEDFSDAESDPLEDFDFDKYAVPSGDSDDEESEDESDDLDFDDAEFQEWLTQQAEAEAENPGEYADDDEVEYVDEESDEEEASDEELTDDSFGAEEDPALYIDEDFLASLSDDDDDAEADDYEEEDEEEEWRPDPSSSIPNIPVVPRNFTPLDDDDDEDEDDEDSYSVGSGGGNNFYYPDTFERDSREEEEESTDEVGDNPFAELNNEKGKKSRKEKPGREKSGEDKPAGGFKQKLAAFKAQAMAELRGEEAPEPGKELAVVEEAETPDKREVKEPKEPGIVSKALAPFKKFYGAIAGFFFGLIVWVLEVLGKLPVVGKYFLKLRDNTKLITVVSNLIPVVLLVLFLAWLNARAVPDETSTDLPDLGSVVFTDFKYEDGVVEGRVVNTGEVIAQAEPLFSVYAMKPGLNPKSWVIPEKQFECSGSTFRVDIDDELVVTAECEESPTGFQVRVSGVVQ